MTEIAIIGGGIGGLAAAAFLHRAGLPATVYEQATEFREVGAGVIVAPNAARLLRALGVLDAFAERAVPLETGWEFRRWQDGSVLSSEDLATKCEDLYGERTYTAHRADLLDAVRRAVPPLPSASAGAASPLTSAARATCCASRTARRPRPTW
jgi:salicylate hydroxylase